MRAFECRKLLEIMSRCKSLLVLTHINLMLPAQIKVLEAALGRMRA